MRRLLGYILPAVALILAASCAKEIQKDGIVTPGVEGPTGGGGKTITDNVVVAHKGAYAEFGLPSNSMAALKKAMELGCYGCECDINMTSDGVVVICHEVAHCGLSIKDNTYADLDAAGKLSNGESLPKFEDFVKAVMEGPGTVLFVDWKSLADEWGGNAQTQRAGLGATGIVRQLGAQKYVRFLIGRVANYKVALEEIGSEWPISYMNSEITTSTFKGYGCTWGHFDLSTFGLDTERLKEWRDAGVTVSFYNFDTKEQMDWYLANRNDIAFASTNYPQTLLEYSRTK